MPAGPRPTWQPLSLLLVLVAAAVVAVAACSCFRCLLKCQSKLLIYCSFRQIRATVMNVNFASHSPVVHCLWLWKHSWDSDGKGREPGKILPDSRALFSGISYDLVILPVPLSLSSLLYTHKSRQCAFPLIPLQLQKVTKWIQCCVLEASVMKTAYALCCLFHPVSAAPPRACCIGYLKRILRI